MAEGKVGSLGGEVMGGSRLRGRWGHWVEKSWEGTRGRGGDSGQQASC